MQDQKSNSGIELPYFDPRSLPRVLPVLITKPTRRRPFRPFFPCRLFLSLRLKSHKSNKNSLFSRPLSPTLGHSLPRLFSHLCRSTFALSQISPCISSLYYEWYVVDRLVYLRWSRPPPSFVLSDGVCGFGVGVVPWAGVSSVPNSFYNGPI